MIPQKNVIFLNDYFVHPKTNSALNSYCIRDFKKMNRTMVQGILKPMTRQS